MTSDEPQPTCVPHGLDAETCVQCHLDADKNEGKKLAKDLGDVLKQHGLETPSDQFGALLGMGVTGLARVVGMPLDQMLEAVKSAFTAAHGGKPPA